MIDEFVEENGDGENIEKIMKLAEESYTDLSKERSIDPDKVYFSRNCEGVSDTLAKKLEENNIAVSLVDYGGWDITHHNFLLVQGDLVVDPTWQQFLEEPNPKLPKVMVTELGKIKNTLDGLGIDAEKQHFWLSARASDSGKKIEELLQSSG